MRKAALTGLLVFTVFGCGLATGLVMDLGTIEATKRAYFETLGACLALWAYITFVEEAKEK